MSGVTPPTPALIVDVAAADRNVARAAGAGIAVRPHFKAHKCTTLLRRQLTPPNARGVTCATAHEAEVLAAAGFDDVLVANEVADVHALAALARAAQHTDVTVAGLWRAETHSQAVIRHGHRPVVDGERRPDRACLEQPETSGQACANLTDGARALADDRPVHFPLER